MSTGTYFKDRISTWLFRSRESRLVKYSRINPVYPFERRAPGVYVFNRIRTDNIISAWWIILGSISFFAYLVQGNTANTFARLDQLFFPCAALLFCLHLIWTSLWPVTVVLNYPRFRYEYYIGEQIISTGPIVDAYIKLKVLFAGEEDLFYHIVVGATDMPETEFTKLSEHGELYRKVAKRLARTLNLNYFDVMDLSHLHECRHATSRHLDLLLGRETGMLRDIEKDIQRSYLTSKIDHKGSCGADPLAITTDSGSKPNWPFRRVEDLNLGVPLERVMKLRAEKHAKETLSWKIRQLPVTVRDIVRYLRIRLVGRTQADDAWDTAIHAAHKAAAHPDEEELDMDMKEQLIAQMEEAEVSAVRRQYIRPLLPLRTGKFYGGAPLSVDDRVMIRHVAHYMALRMSVRRSGQEVPGLSEELSFLGLYTAHRNYQKYYHATMEALDPLWKWHTCCGNRKRKVHPIDHEHEG